MVLGNLIESGLISIPEDLNEAYNKILLWFFSYPDKEMGLNDLCDGVNISKTTGNKVVSKLVKEGFLEKEVLGKVWRIKCKKDHIYNFSRKVAFNLTNVHESGIIKQVKKIMDNPRAIILFGSYRKGDDNEKSDIDIAVEVLGNKDLQIKNIGIIKKFGYRKDVKVNLHIFSRNKIDLNLFSNIANGIVLEGFLEVRP
jgi:predicted nucleotidyltransferase